ncbi:unnamed protein product [Vicia faba]|uniref:Cytochrome P450 n=1 Tax=Vicia faba TaxID=3906 RepID=A0AAV1A1Y9_VICFA|nr:unnamed protein product [Vicia faba]
MYFATTVFLLFLSYIAITLFSRTKTHINLPPGPSLFTLMLNASELGKQKPQHSLAKLSKIYGPIMRLKLGQITTFVISSPEIAQEVLQTHDLFLSDRTIPQAVAVLDHQHFSLPFMPACDLWRDLKKISKNHLFSSKTLDASYQLRCNKLQDFLCDIDRSSIRGEAVDIGRAAFKTTLNFLSNTFFSMDFANSAGETDEYKDIIENLVRVIGTPNLVDFFPVLSMFDPKGIKGISSTFLEKLLQIIDSYTTKRLKIREGENYIPNDDMLDMLLNISQENGQKMDNTKIKHLFLDLFVAGTDTTSYIIERAMAELIHNPHVMAKAKEELEQGQYFQFTPFGGGRRMCPGMPLAIRMLHTMLGSLINSFDWKKENRDRDIDQPLRDIPIRVNKL